MRFVATLHSDRTEEVMLECIDRAAAVDRLEGVRAQMGLTDWVVGKVVEGEQARTGPDPAVAAGSRVYVRVRLDLAAEADAQETVSQCSYRFVHPDIVGTEIVDVEEDGDGGK